MTGETRRASSGKAPLLSISELAELTGVHASTLYRSINRGSFPIPIIRLGSRIRVSRAAAERLVGGEDGVFREEPALRPAPGYCWRCSALLSSPPMCSAARTSSSGTASV